MGAPRYSVSTSSVCRGLWLFLQNTDRRIDNAADKSAHFEVKPEDVMSDLCIAPLRNWLFRSQIDFGIY